MKYSVSSNWESWESNRMDVFYIGILYGNGFSVDSWVYIVFFLG